MKALMNNILHLNVQNQKSLMCYDISFNLLASAQQYESVCVLECFANHL